jgi:hypothetical protein
MPKKPKTEKADKKTDKKAAVVQDESSSTGSQHEKEADMETRRYASITGDVTPPSREIASEKA